MKKLTLFYVVIAICILVSFVVTLFIDAARVVGVYKYSADVRVIDEQNRIGFNTDTDGLHFGSISSGSGSRRVLILRDIAQDVRVQIVNHGEIASWISSENNFILKKGEEKNLSFSLSVPSPIQVGNYTGEVTIVLRKI